MRYTQYTTKGVLQKKPRECGQIGARGDWSSLSTHKAQIPVDASRAWNLSLDCLSQDDIAKAVGVEQQTVSNWLTKFRTDSDFSSPPESRQHFDVWNFQKADGAVTAWEGSGASEF